MEPENRDTQGGAANNVWPANAPGVGAPGGEIDSADVQAMHQHLRLPGVEQQKVASPATERKVGLPQEETHPDNVQLKGELE